MVCERVCVIDRMTTSANILDIHRLSEILQKSKHTKLLVQNIEHTKEECVLIEQCGIFEENEKQLLVAIRHHLEQLDIYSKHLLKKICSTTDRLHSNLSNDDCASDQETCSMVSPPVPSSVLPNRGYPPTNRFRFPTTEFQSFAYYQDSNPQPAPTRFP